MEKFIRPYDKEYIRMAVLKHEEMFRAQVYELHRLYHIQKILMKYCQEGKTISRYNQDKWNSKNTTNLKVVSSAQDSRLDAGFERIVCRLAFPSVFHEEAALKSRTQELPYLGEGTCHRTKARPQQHVDLEQPAQKCIEESEGDEALYVEDDSEIELTLGPPCSYRRRNAETLFTLDSAQSFSSISSTSSKHLQRTNLLGKPQKKDKTIKNQVGKIGEILGCLRQNLVS